MENGRSFVESKLNLCWSNGGTIKEIVNVRDIICGEGLLVVAE